MDPKFQNCNSEAVFRAVQSKVKSEEARALWGRMWSEIQRAGVSGAISYLEGEFTRAEEELDRELEP